MPCYHPIPIQRDPDGGRPRLDAQRDRTDGYIPCGKCLGCRTDTAKDWTLRAVHESRLWKNNTFITLTYEDAQLPPELIPAHLTNFLKRLRKSCSSNDRILTDRSASIRYLACGEYGEHTERPHYHACLFNCDLADRRPYSQNLYTSQTLNAIWTHGETKLRPFDAGAAGYIAGYITKHGKTEYYGPPDADGVCVLRHPPFKRQSSRPALGRTWLDRYASDLQHGYAVYDGRKTRIPRYYIKKLLENHEDKARVEDIRAARREYTDKTDTQRREAQEIIHTQRIQTKKRNTI